MPSYFQDAVFQDRLIALACRDQHTLKLCSPVLSAKDFRPLPGSNNGQARWVIAQIAFEHWDKFKEPVGDLLSSEILNHCQLANLGERQKETLLGYAKDILQQPLNGASRIIEKAIAYKRERWKASAIQKLIQEQDAGTLTDARWLELTRDVVQMPETQQLLSTDYFENLESRMIRRSQYGHRRHPLFLIGPLDALIHGISRGELACLLAPFKRGKSLGLIWLALAYTIQKFNVLYITLEDPMNEVTDRLDQCVTGLTAEKLRTPELDNTVRKRFQRFRRLVRTKLKLIDGTEQGVSVARLEEIIERERREGFMPDALFIDYDDYLVPAVKNPERRFELGDIYTSLRQLAARQGIFIWTAAQTQRGTENLKIISADKFAEDISKARKVSLALSVGQGDWGEDSFFLWVAAHKTDKAKIGCNILSTRDKAMFYDHLRTLRHMQAIQNPVIPNP